MRVGARAGNDLKNAECNSYFVFILEHQSTREAVQRFGLTEAADHSTSLILQNPQAVAP